MKRIYVKTLVTRTLDALRMAGVSKKKLKDYKYCGIGPIMQHFAAQGISSYSKSEVDSLLFQTRLDYESGNISRFKWGIIRKSASMLEDVYTTGKVSFEPLTKWEALHNPLHQEPSPAQLCDRDNLLVLVYLTKQELLKFGLSPKAMRNYTYDGFDPILRYCEEEGITKYEPEKIECIVLEARTDYENQRLGRNAYQSIRKAASLLNEYHETGKLTWGCLPNWGTRNATSHFAQIVDLYCEEKRTTGELCKGTIATSKSAILNFLFCLEDMGFRDFSEVTRQVVNDCIPILAIQYPCGMRGMMSAVRSFLGFLNEHKIASDDLLASIPEIVSPRRKIREGFTPNEINKILSAVDRQTAVGKRDYAMLMMAVQTGLRVVDISGLTFSNIDWRRMEIRVVQQKTGNPLWLPLEPETGNAVADYLLYGRPSCDLPYLFLCKDKPFRRLLSRSASGIATRYMTLAGIDRDSIPRRGFHSFRRSFGARLLGAEISVDMLHEILGHANMDSAKPYIAVDEKGLQLCAIGLSGLEVKAGELL